MNRVPSLIGSLIAGAFLSTSVFAHNPPPKQNNLVLLGPDETLQVAFSADCNGKQDDDAYVVAPDLREITFTFRARGSNVGGSTGEYIDTISMLNGNVAIFDVPANIGQLLKLSVEKVSGQGVCSVSATGRVVGPSGETRAAGGLSTEMWATIVDR